MNQSKYQQLGASATKAGLHQALNNIGLNSENNYFCHLLNDIAGDPAYSSFLHCDGAGTKGIVCYLMYKSSGDPKVFGGLAQDALVMNLDDIFCLGRPEKLVVSNLIGRNAQLISDEIIEVIIGSYKELCASLRHMGIDIEMGGGETADCGDVIRTIMVDAVVAGRIKKDNLINPQRIVPGDVIIGISNTGQASYENKPNSSMGSNGLTLARHALLNKKCAELYPEVLDPNIDKSAAYGGPFFVSDLPNKLGMTAGAGLSSPTRTYAPVLAKIYSECVSEIHGCIHNTGGGQTKVLRFGQGNIYVKDNLFPTPPLFELIQEHGKVPWMEMYQVFNMGHRIELYVPATKSKEIIEIVKSFKLEAKEIGHVEKNTDSATSNKVIVRSPHGAFEYSL